MEVYSLSQHFLRLNFLLVLIFGSPIVFSETIKTICRGDGTIQSVETSGQLQEFAGQTSGKNLEPPPDRREFACKTMNQCLGAFANLGSLSKDLVKILANSKKDFDVTINRLSDRNLSSIDHDEAIDKLSEKASDCNWRLQVTQKSTSSSVFKLKSIAGLNKNKQGAYDVEALREIIRHALHAGVDPYLAMAIAITEHPPTPKGAHSAYSQDYGLMPVDAVAAYSELGCIYSPSQAKKFLSHDDLNSIQALRAVKDKIGDELDKIPVGNPARENKSAKFKSMGVQMDSLKNEIASKEADPDKRAIIDEAADCLGNSICAGFLHPREPMNVDFRDFPDQDYLYSSQKFVCSADGVVDTSLSVNFAVVKTPKGNCCAHINGSLDDGAAIHKLVNHLGVLYIKDQIQKCIVDSGNSFSYCAQKYNGLGCFGCNKEMKNDCFDHLQMSTHPIYGARIGDLMLASLMNRPEVNAMIADESRVMSRPVVSSFCIGRKKGPLTQNSNQFLAEQRKILAGRPQCQNQLK